MSTGMNRGDKCNRTPLQSVCVNGIGIISKCQVHVLKSPALNQSFLGMAHHSGLFFNPDHVLLSLLSQKSATSKFWVSIAVT